MQVFDYERFVRQVPVDSVRGRRGVLGPTWNDLRVLLALLKICKPISCLEIGIHHGHTASLLLGSGASIEHYVGIDRQMKNAPKDGGSLVKDDPRVTLAIRGKGTRSIPAGELPHQPFDWIFIDSDHSYKGVRFDTAYGRSVLAPGGILIWHDYEVPSQYRPGGAWFGVRRVLREEPPNPPICCFKDPLHTSSIAFQSTRWPTDGMPDQLR